MRETPLNLRDRYLLKVLGFTGSSATSMIAEGDMKVEAIDHGLEHVLITVTLPGPGGQTIFPSR